MAAPPFPVVCTACTENHGACLTHRQARIHQLDAGAISATSVCVSGLLQSTSANLQTLLTQNFAAENVVGTLTVPSVVLGSASLVSDPAAAVLNGQQLQAGIVRSGGLVPKSSANGSVILLGADVLPGGCSVAVLDDASLDGTSFFFYNAGSSAAILACSGGGQIVAAGGVRAPTFAVAAQGRGTVFKAQPGVWVVSA